MMAIQILRVSEKIDAVDGEFPFMQQWVSETIGSNVMPGAGAAAGMTAMSLTLLEVELARHG
jgi:glycerate kinase